MLFTIFPTIYIDCSILFESKRSFIKGLKTSGCIELSRYLKPFVISEEIDKSQFIADFSK